MKIKSLVFLLCLNFFSVSCFKSFYCLSANPLNLITKEVAQKIACEFKLEISGIGGSSKNSKKNEVYFRFHHLGAPLNIEQSKKLIVDVTENLVSYFNSLIEEKKLQDCLITFPFDTKNIVTTILSFNNSGISYEDPYIVVVKSISHQIWIMTNEPGNPYRYKQEIEEPYIDAVIKFKGADYAAQAPTCQKKSPEI